MKRFSLPLVAAASLLLMVACGGGGGVAPPVTPSPSTVPTATPLPTPTPKVLNTSLTAYLPLARGNFWTFSPGSRMTDVGTFWLTCTCPYTFGLMEEIDIHDRFGSFGGSLFFTKQQGTTGTIWSNLIGVREPGQTLVSLIYDQRYPLGLPLMDDVPSVDETWTVLAGGATLATSTIVSIGGTLPLPNNEQVVNVATDEISEATFGRTLTMSFAQGVGFTQVSIAGRNADLTSFTVDELRGVSFPPSGAIGTLPGVLQPADFGDVIVRLFI